LYGVGSGARDGYFVVADDFYQGMVTLLCCLSGWCGVTCLQGASEYGACSRLPQLGVVHPPFL